MIKKLLILLLICCTAFGTVNTEDTDATGTGDGSDTTFDFDFGIFNTSDIVVQVVTTATGAAVTQTETTHYSVSATNNNYWSGPGGTVTFVTAPTSAQTVYMYRDPAFTQTYNLNALSSFRSASTTTMENTLDKLLTQIQYLQLQLDTCVKVPQNERGLTLEANNAVDRADTYVTFDSDGNISSAESAPATAVTLADIIELKQIMNLDHVFDVRDYGATGDGSTDDEDEIEAAITAATANGGIVLFPNEGGSTYKFLTAITVPSDVTLWFASGASIMGDGSSVLTDNGGVIDTKHQIFQSTMTYDPGDGVMDYVRPEYWGGRAGADADVAIDSTAAINAAAATEKPVLFMDGYYKSTGGHNFATDGIWIRGSGIRSVDDDGGTVIVKKSGTEDMFGLGSYSGMEFSNLTIDCNNLSGSGIYYTGYYGSIHDVRITDVNGVDQNGYAIHLLQANQNRYYNIHINESDGGIYIERSTTAGYSSFDRIGFALADGFSGKGIYMTGNNVNYTFNCLQLEPGPVCLDVTDGGAIMGVHFSECSTEAATSDPVFKVDNPGAGTNVRNISFKQIRPYVNGVAGTGAIFNLEPLYGCTIEDVYIRDESAIVDKSMITMSGCLDVRISQIGVYADANFVGIACTSKCTNIVADTFYESGGAGSGKMTWWADNIHVKHTPLPQSFTGASSGIFAQETGTVTWTNATQYYEFIEGDIIASSDLTALGGIGTFGVDGASRGSIVLWDGASGNTPGYMKIHSPNGTAWYVFVEDDGTLKAHNAVPTQNSDGSAIGDQTD